MPGHQLQCWVVCNFFRTNGIQYQRLLIDPEKNKIRMGLGFAAFTAQHVVKTSLRSRSSKETERPGKNGPAQPSRSKKPRSRPKSASDVGQANARRNYINDEARMSNFEAMIKAE